MSSDNPSSGALAEKVEALEKDVATLKGENEALREKIELVNRERIEYLQNVSVGSTP
jgi:chaperonin cofactor prefoldin